MGLKVRNETNMGRRRRGGFWVVKINGCIIFVLRVMGYRLAY